MSGISFEVVKAEHVIKVREAEEARVWAQFKRTHGSHSVLKNLLMLFNRG